MTQSKCSLALCTILTPPGYSEARQDIIYQSWFTLRVRAVRIWWCLEVCLCYVLVLCFAPCLRDGNIGDVRKVPNMEAWEKLVWSLKQRIKRWVWGRRVVTWRWRGVSGSSCFSGYSYIDWDALCIVLWLCMLWMLMHQSSGQDTNVTSIQLLSAPFSSFHVSSDSSYSACWLPPQAVGLSDAKQFTYHTD